MRVSSWRSEGWQSSGAAATGIAGDVVDENSTMSRAGNATQSESLKAGAEDEVIPVIEGSRHESDLIVRFA